MTRNRDKEFDCAQTRHVLAGKTSVEDLTRRCNWLGHKIGSKADRCDRMLIDGATRDQIQAVAQYEHGPSEVDRHVTHLEDDHGLPIDRRPDGFRIFDRKKFDLLD